MPPEPLPWDRKDLFKERKHERPESLVRWREAPSMSSYHHGPSRELTRCGSADFRRHPGHARQGVWHQFAGDVAHGFGPSRSADKIFEAESCRPFFSRGDGKYFRNGIRENRGSYSQRDWKGHTWETSNSSPNTYGRLDYMNNELRSVDDILTYPPHTHSEFVNSCNQLHPKDQHDNKASGGNGLGAGLKSERENSVGSMEWKPLKWSRSGSLSSQGPGFSHSNGSKSLGGLDSSERKAEFQQKNATLVQSPSGDAAACVISAALSDETTSRKKPRLGWGEGLAKYEKKKVEGPDTSVSGVGTTISVSNQELNHSMTSNLADKSPRVLALSDCASPATPSSVACSSSSGVEEKSFSKAINGDNDINELCVSLRATHSVCQKHRSSLHSAGNLSLVPTMEMINFVSKLLSESQVKDHRNSLKMPALILDKKEKQLSRFASSNGLIEDPRAVEKERSLINPWTSDEKDIFMDKLATFGKDFRKIASFLDHKTTADCVEFYYKNHKSDGFEKTKKLDLSKQWKSATSTYLVTSGKKWSRERNAASLDVLGAASVIAAHAESRIGNQQMSSGRIFLRRCYESKRPRVEDGTMERSSSFGFTGDDRETAAVDVLAGICGSLSSEAMSSCITSSVDPGNSKWKSQKVDSVMKWTSTSDVTQNVDDDTCSDESCGEPDPADWTDEEKSIFVQAFSSYGKDFSMISRCVRTRSQDQCRVFFSKVRKCLGLDLINTKARNMGTPLSDDANGDGNDMEDTSILKSSVVAVDKLGSKVDDDLPRTVTINEEGSDPAGALNLQASLNISEDNKEMGVLDHGNSEAVESVVSHVSWLADRPQPNCRSHGDVVDDNNQQLESELGQEIVALTDVETGKEQGTEQCTSAGEVVDACPCNLNSEIESKSLVQCSIKSFENKLMAQDPLLAKSKSDDRDEKFGADTVSQGFSFGPKVLHRVSLELDSPQKPTVMLAEEGSILADPNSKSQDSDGSLCDKMCNQDRVSSTHDFQASKDKCGHKSVSGDEYTASNHAESSQIPMLTISTEKEINVDTSGKQHPDVQSRLKSDMDEGGWYLTQDCYDKKCNNSISQSSAAALPFLSQSSEQTSDHPRARLQSLSDTEKPCRNGNVKLFGQILNSSGDEDGKGTNLLKRGVKLSNLKLNGHHQVDVSSTVLKFDREDYLGLESVPVSFGFWDGNRIQTGNSSLPDSSILMMKYPAAFGNYPAVTSKMDQQALPSAGKSNDLNSNDVSVIPSMDISSNGVVDYQMSIGLDGSKVQPFSLDVKKPRQEVSSEVQQRGIDAIPSLQHQGREMVGMNDLGRTRVLAGGGSTGVSDPVAALHHVRTELYSGQTGGISREEESRRGNGGISR
ncbi:hypothetical protein SLA2020_391910 [Shorea laevis]